MTEDPPPLLPEIKDAWGRPYVPRDPKPNFRAVPLHAGDLLGLWIWCSQAAIARLQKGEEDMAMVEQWRAVEFARLAVELQPILQQYIDADGRTRGLDCIGSA